ncbi:hypothetical protein VTK26DRAFT_2493 [Humicola hyalothermophila]
MHQSPPFPRSLPDPVWFPLSARVNGSGSDSNDSDDELQNWSSLIGIVTAICGNILIALALNVQRHAHIRLHRKRLKIRERARQATKSAAAAARAHESGGGIYGAAAASPTWDPNGVSNGAANPSPSALSNNGRYSNDDARASSETEPLAQSFRSDESSDDSSAADREEKVASTYLKDPYWWLGQIMNTVGELGNFLAYGFAPASIVSPLGVVAIVSNCVIAPLFFKELFRQRDFWGVIIAITGAVTVVLSAKTEETKLGPHEVWGAITTLEFEIYTAVTCSLIVLLMWLSPKYGSRTILIDLGLVGLFGGYTALATKGVSSMLSSTLFGAFTTPLTYVLAFILVFTAIMQIRYVNKALQRFESTQVIPTQFVLFTISVIIGSAVLYRDFERTTSEQAIKFVGGCLFTFFGVFLITSGRPRQDDEEEAATLSDVEGIEETIGLAEQDRRGGASRSSRRAAGVAAAKSRGSSRASRKSLAAANRNKPLPRVPAASSAGAARSPLGVDDEDDYDEDAPLLGGGDGSNPWSDAVPYREPPHAAVPTTTPAASVSNDVLLPRLVTPAPAPTPATTTTTASSTTPKSRLHHVVYSPSPFSSTLSAVVGDKLLKSLAADVGEGVTGGVGGNASRGGTSWRASLFGPPLVAQQAASAGRVLREGGEGERGEADGEAGDGGSEGLRGRARSLSHTLRFAGLFGGGGGGGGRGTVASGGRNDRDANAEEEWVERGAALGEALARARTAVDAADSASSSSGSASFSANRGRRTGTL